MRKALFILLMSFLVVAFSFFGSEVQARVGQGMMGYGYGMGPEMMWRGGYGGWYCPYCGQPVSPRGGYGMGPGMMGPWMMGPGMMGPWMMGPGYPGYGPRYGEPQKPLEEKDVKAVVKDYIESTRNPNLKMGKIKEMENFFEVEILTKDNSLVDKILVDKFTGWMRSAY